MNYNINRARYSLVLHTLHTCRRLLVFCALLVTALISSSPAARAATLTVPAGGDFQAALNTAQPGDTIVLTAGATYTSTTGGFTLPAKYGTSYITIQSSALSSLPAAGTRVKPQDAANMPKIVSPGFGNPALKTEASAHHFRFVGIEFKPQDANAFAYDLIQFGDGTSAQNTLDKVPHDLALDRCYIHAYDAQEIKRGVALNSASTDITNCYISSLKVRGQEAQAIMGYNGPGPYRIINNYLEAAGENIMFGGATASINNLIPSDIEIRGNYMTKPLSWRGVYTVKNIFELKNAQRVKIDGNIFENCWVNAQVGYAILFTVRNEDGAMPWATVSDVQFTNNIVRHASAGVNILGHDDNPAPSVTAHNIAIRNNLFEDLNSATWDGDGAFMKITESIGVTVDHNTIFQTGNAIFAYGNANTNFAFTNNIIAHNSYGICGDGHAFGNDTLNFYFPGSTVTGNALVAAGPPPNGPFLEPERWYPAGNYYPLSFDAVGFANRAAGDYRLTSTSPYKNKGTDGKDVGADIEAINAATTNSTPFTGTATAVPGIIEAENFDNGGEGVAYHDTDVGNNGGVYRSTDVDIRARTTASNGYAVYNSYPGEWLKYTINVTASGVYSVGASVACEMEGGTFHFEVDGADVTGPMKVPTTGWWLTFQTISRGGVNLTAGTHVLRLVLDSPGYYGVIADFDTINITKWSDQDIGSVGVVGSASTANGTVTLKGSGADIWDTTDGFHYLYQSLTGDGQIVARVASLQNTDSWAKSGVMIRETFAANSTHASMFLTPGNGLAFQRRTSTGAYSAHTAGGSATSPYWVKLARSGSTFTTYVSSDGVNWLTVGSDTISMTSSVYIGLAVTSHNNSALTTATLDNVTVLGK